MIERYLHHVRVELPSPDESAAGARVRLVERFPRPALRRMTHLGLLIGSVLDFPLTPEDAVVYASSYAETRALEEYLNSFPTPSPLLFQTSIHPGGVQQVLIGRQQPIARLWPLAGRTRLLEQAWLTVLLEPADRVALVGGEERGTWMREYGVAASRAFAFAVLVTPTAAGAIGRISFRPDPGPDESCPSLEDFPHVLAQRLPLAWHGAGGAWQLNWS